MKKTLLIVLMAWTTMLQAQDVQRPLAKRVIVKTNLASLVARRPTASIEKVVGKQFTLEACFVQGEFNNVLFTDHYNYNGFLLRGKQHMYALNFGQVNPYIGAYAGTLRRNIYREGAVDASGFFGYSHKYFSANSIRGGINTGISFYSKNKFVVEGLFGLGYGRYLSADYADPAAYAKGYLDMQTWLSVGYCF